jgi:hypothetical protein
MKIHSILSGVRIETSHKARTSGYIQRIYAAVPKILTTIMTQSREPNDRDLFTRIAQVEYRLLKIENTQAELENTMTPGGYITEAFDRVHEEIDQFRNDVNTRLDEQNNKLDEQNRKIDLILRHITGLSNNP